MLGFEVFYQLQEVESLGKGESARLVEGTVEVLAEQACTVVTDNNAVGIDHGNNVGYKILAELLGFWLIAAYVLKEALANKRTVSLSGMNPASDHNNLFIMGFSLVISNFKDRNGKTTQTFQRRVKSCNF